MKVIEVAGVGKAKPLRLLYIDGLRGLAALAIVLHHIHLRMVVMAGTHSWLAMGPQLLTGAHCVVSLFVVLSGYSLMIPVVRSGDSSISGGLAGYARRRVRRILPAYYAALLFSLAPLLPALLGWKLPGQSGAAVDLSRSSVAAHFLLLQNLRADWARQINSPLWSIASEWQLYVAFPLVLLPLWRRFGSITTIIIALVLGSAAGYFTGFRGDCCPWYLGLFAMGMTGAAIGFSTQPVKWCWGWTALTAAATTAGASFIEAPLLVIDAIAGMSTISLLIFCGRSPGRLTCWLECRPIVALGLISYSLYLIHQPIVTMAATVLARLCEPNATLWLVPIVAVVASGIAAMMLYWMFERPFLANRRQTTDSIAIAAAIEPAV